MDLIRVERSGAGFIGKFTNFSTDVLNGIRQLYGIFRPLCHHKAFIENKMIEWNILRILIKSIQMTPPTSIYAIFRSVQKAFYTNSWYVPKRVIASSNEVMFSVRFVWWQGVAWVNEEYIKFCSGSNSWGDPTHLVSLLLILHNTTFGLGESLCSTMPDILKSSKWC